METQLYCYTFFLDVQPIANSSKLEAFNMFKILELFDGKIVLDASTLDPDMVVYLTEFKQQLNEHIAKETEKRQKEIDKLKRSKPKNVDVDDPEFVKNTFSHMMRRGKR